MLFRVHASFLVDAAGIWSSWRGSWRRTTQRSAARWTWPTGRKGCLSGLACYKRTLVFVAWPDLFAGLALMLHSACI